MSSWARSGRKPAARSGRSAEGFVLAVARAEEWWCTLTGARGRSYSDVAASAILSLAVALWPTSDAEGQSWASGGDASEDGAD